ncbi:UNVERIFIED_CONTAM: alanine dehydrogenase [Brevibacillus sp. OAP136]
MGNVLVINQEIFKDLVTQEEAIQIVESAFTQLHENKSIVFPAVRQLIEEHNGIFGIKSSYLIDEKSVGLKAGGFWKGNGSRGKANHQSTMLLLDPETGEPMCLLDANHLTSLRTGAAGAVAAKYLARSVSKTVTLIGAGLQARSQLSALLQMFPIEEVVVFSQTEVSSRKLAEEIGQKGIAARYTDCPQKAVEQADIVVTTTPSFSPVIKSSWLREGTHVNAMGSDTKGKRELEIDRAFDIVVCDLWEQSTSMGELQNAEPETPYLEIGQLTSKEKPGRQSAHEITLFDSTGVAVQDLSVALHVYRRAKELGVGVTVEL